VEKPAEVEGEPSGEAVETQPDESLNKTAKADDKDLE
jgi:hypothetical protein